MEVDEEHLYLGTSRMPDHNEDATSILLRRAWGFGGRNGVPLFVQCYFQKRPNTLVGLMEGNRNKTTIITGEEE